MSSSIVDEDISETEEVNAVSSNGDGVTEVEESVKVCENHFSSVLICHTIHSVYY